MVVVVVVVADMVAVVVAPVDMVVFVVAPVGMAVVEVVAADTVLLPVFLWLELDLSSSIRMTRKMMLRLRYLFHIGYKSSLAYLLILIRCSLFNIYQFI